MIAASIPVFLWRRTAYLQYKWHLPEDPKLYSIFIDRRAMNNGTSIRAVLEGPGEERVKRMKDKIVEYIPKFVYTTPKEGLAGMKDAFDFSLEGVLRRFQEQRRT